MHNKDKTSVYLEHEEYTESMCVGVLMHFHTGLGLGVGIRVQVRKCISQDVLTGKPACQL